MLSSALFFCCLLTAFVLSRLICHWALKLQWLDVPNHRSAHEMPTPSGGGVAIVVAVVFGVGLLVTLGSVPGSFLIILLAPVAIAVLGLVDDIASLSASIRIPFHFAAAIGLVFVVGSFPDIGVNGLVIELKWAGYVVGVFYLVWLLNLYNFMDGIDGLAASEAVFVAVGACLLLLSRDARQEIWLMLVLAGSCAGFLVTNWPPARLFMGDVGSGFLGITLGALSLMTVNEGLIPIWSWLILLSLFVVDASVTLITRLLRGEKVHEAHSLHAYQHATRFFGGKRVLLGVLAIDILYLLPLAWMANEKENFGFVLFVIAYVPIAVLCWGCGSGRAEANLWKTADK